MKFYITLIALFTISYSFAQKSTLQIPPSEVVELDYPNYDYYKATLKKKGSGEIDVAVISKKENRQIKGFGLGLGEVAVFVEAENKLVLSNASDKAISIDIHITLAEKPSAEQNQSISFTLRNTSAKSIPLIIPTVMNPNLSPMSNSGVDLRIGQEILFKAKGRRYVLLTVDESIQEGDVLDVAKILKAKKKELGL